jgi:DNA polymerase III epsilon subunit family exonuclease
MSTTLKATTFAFVDVETTGLSLMDGKKHNRIIEIGVVLVNPQKGVLFEKSWLLNPDRHIPIDATWIHGIGDDDVIKAPRFKDIANDFNGILAQAERIWGFNSPFDLRFLTQEFLLASIEQPNWEFFDVRRLTTRFGIAGSLQETALALGIETKQVHRALSDARLTKDLLFVLFEAKIGLNTTLGELEEFHNAHSPAYNTITCRNRILAQQAKKNEELPRICVTGKLEGITRDQIKKALLDAGFKYKKEISNDIEFVVLGQRPTRRKVETAEVLGLELMSGDQFMRWLNAKSHPTNSP